MFVMFPGKFVTTNLAPYSISDCHLTEAYSKWEEKTENDETSIAQQ